MTPVHPIRSRHGWRSARGFGALAAILVTVLLGALAAAVVRLGWSSQVGFAQDIASARALRAANAGAEFGLYQAFKGSWTACSGNSQTLDLRTDTGFFVTVSCSSNTYNEGDDGTGTGTPQTITVYTISAVACNGTATCPDNAQSSSPSYIERERLVQATSR